MTIDIWVQTLGCDWQGSAQHSLRGNSLKSSFHCPSTTWCKSQRAYKNKYKTVNVKITKSDPFLLYVMSTKGAEEISSAVLGHLRFLLPRRHEWAFCAYAEMLQPCLYVCWVLKYSSQQELFFFFLRDFQELPLTSPASILKKLRKSNPTQRSHLTDFNRAAWWIQNSSHHCGIKNIFCKY